MEQTLIELIKRYDCSGPRYTSYPPAPTFTSSFGPDEYRKAIAETEANMLNPDLSLYVHFPFCDTLCYFCGCTTIITRNRSRIDEYLGYVKREIDLLAPLMNERRKVTQMHWGGGTPTYLTPSQIADTATSIRSAFRFSEDAEVSVEVDPRDLTFHHLKVLRQSGFNRISIGVQDFNPKVQYAINRNQSEFLTREVIDWSRSVGFSSLNIDLIYGLPLQTVQSFTETLEKIIAIGPERIAVYNFAFVPWMKKHQRVIHVEDLPSADVKLQILTTTVERLSEAGYVYIGMDHFARPDDELSIAQRSRTLHRNFQGYSTHADADMYALGMSSIGHFGGYYAQNAKSLPDYYGAIQRGEFATRVGYEMSPDDRLRKHVIMRLMCDLHLEKSDVEEQFGISFDTYFRESLEKLEPLIQDHLIEVTHDALTIPLKGRFFLRNIAMCFDAYLKQVHQQKPLFSRTV